MKTLHIVGRKKSGKTSLLVRLIPRLQQRGLRVGSVKHSAHPHSLDREGSDSWLHREAGAEITMMITAATVSVHFGLPKDAGRLDEWIERNLGALDVVLIEGWADRTGPRVEVIPADNQGHPREPRLRDSSDLIAVVLAKGLQLSAERMAELGYVAWSPKEETCLAPGLPCFHWHEIDACAEFIFRFLRARD